MLSSLKFCLVFAAVMAASCCVSSQAYSQGFRLGNFMQAGGGQGFRMGFGGFGMHFGGGQGATIGGQNLGMRFGNGQGARFGGVNYGMQFGGGQGTQIGQLYTTPMVQPGTYYYGDVRDQNYAYGQPMVAPQNIYPSPAAPTLATQTNGVPASSAQPDSISPLQLTAMNGYIRLSHPADATESMKYRLNGTEFSLKPGSSVLMASGEQWNVVFSAGEGFGDREATLSESGSFEFSKSADEGWILVENEPTITASIETDVPSIAPANNETTSTLDNAPNSEQSVLINEASAIEPPKADDSAPAVEKIPADETGEDKIAPADEPNGAEIAPSSEPKEIEVVPASSSQDDNQNR